MSRFAALAVALTAVAAATGCSTPARPEPPRPECQYNSDCATGQVCLPGGSCAAECKVSRDCAAGWVCRVGACADAVSCNTPADCATAGDQCLGNVCVSPCEASGTCATGPFQVVVSSPSYRLAGGGGVLWALTGGGAARVEGNAVKAFGAADGQVSGPTTSSALENGGPITAVDFPGAGKAITSVTGPIGTLAATWAGGTVTSWTGLDRVAATLTRVSGTLTGATFAGATRLATLTDPATFVRASTVTDGRYRPATLTADTGVTASATPTVLTTTGLTAGALVGKCLTDIYAGTRSVAVTANDATTVTVGAGGADLSTLFPAGRRWFAVSCTYPYYATYTVAQPAGPAAPLANGSYLDCYLGTVPVWDLNVYYYGGWTVAGAGASTFTVTAPVSRWAQLAEVPGSGACAAAAYSSVTGRPMVPVTVTDLAGAFPPVAAGTLDRIVLEGTDLLLPLTATTATTVTFETDAGSLPDYGLGTTYRFASSATGNAFATVGPVSGASAGQFLHVDSTGYRYPIRAVNGTAVTIEVPMNYNGLPLGWTGSWAAPVATASGLPALTVTDPTVTTVDALKGMALLLVEPPAELQAYQGTHIVGLGTATGNDAAGVLAINMGTCGSNQYYSCPFRLRNYLRDLPGARYTSGALGSAYTYYPTGYYGGAAWFTATAPAAAWLPDALVGRTVSLDGFTGSATVLGNTATTALLQVADGAFPAFDAFLPGAGLLVPNSSGGAHLVLTDAAAANAADAYRGWDLVAANGAVVGSIRGNGATTFDLDVSSVTSSTLAQLTTGARYALARPPGVLGWQAACYPNGYLEVTAQVSGAALAAAAYDALTLENGTSLGVIGNDASQVQAIACPYHVPALLQGQGKVAVASASGSVTVKLSDGAGGVLSTAQGKQLVFFADPAGTFYPITSPAVATADASGATFVVAPDEALAFGGSRGVGARFALADGGAIPATFTATLPAAATPAADGLKGRFVTLLGTSGQERLVRVRTNAAGAVTADLDPGDARMLSSDPDFAPSLLFTSQGGLLRITSAAASLTPGALVGRRLLVRLPDLYSTQPFDVVDNTATELVVAAADPETAVVALRGGAWVVPGLATYGYTTNALALLPDGSALVGAYGSGPELWQLGATGVASITTRLGSATRLQLTPAAPRATGALPAPTRQGSTAFYTFSSATWSFTPGELRGARLVTRPAGYEWMAFPVVENTATSFTILCSYAYYGLAAGLPFTLDTGDLTVTGTTLTANALAGKALWVNGLAYPIRSNTASAVRLALDAGSGSSLQWAVQARRPALLPGPAATTGFVLDGLAGTTLYAVASDGAGGTWVGTDLGVQRHDGTAWTRFGDLETATQLAAGTLTGYAAASPGDTLVDSAAAYVPGALVGKRLVTATGVFTIYGNTATELRLSYAYDGSAPLVGESYRIVDDDGLGQGYDLSVASGAVLAGTSRGMSRFQAGAWRHWTPASTESARGRNDGLPGPVWRLAASGAGDAWLRSSSGGSSYTVHWVGGTTDAWSRYTTTTTESAFGKRDGLPSDDVQGFFLQDATTTWFATSSGAARLSGTTWTQYGAAASYPTSVNAVWVDAASATWFATSSGLIKLR